MNCSFSSLLFHCRLLVLASTVLPSVALANQLTLSWTDNSNNESGFNIERSVDGIAFTQIATIGADLTTYTDAGLAPSTSYSYRVRAFNANGDSSYSNVTAATTPALANVAPTISNLSNRTINEDASTGQIAFTVGDAETAAGSLVVTANSSNTALVPQAGLVLGGSGASRTLTVTPAANQSGSATITVTVSDGALTGSASFVLTVNAVNDAPTISNITDRSITAGTNTGAIAFTVADIETTAGSLVVTAASSNTTLVPQSGIVFGGSGANRTVTVTPAADQSGTATITVTVSDSALGASASFVLTVNAVNDAPTISDMSDQTIDANTSTEPVAFKVGDVDTPLNSLVLTGISSNSTLVPQSGIAFGGSGADRAVTVTPAANQSGTATITVTVSDGALSASDTFVLTVNPDPVSASNLLSNGGFESGMTSWSFYTDGTGSVVASGPAHEGTQAAVVTTTTGGKNIQLFQHGLRLEPNTDYQLSFAAYSSTGRDLRVSLGRHVSPYTNYGINKTQADLTSSWNTFTINFRSVNFSTAVDDGRLFFWFADDAQAGDRYYIDNVVLARAGSTVPANTAPTLSEIAERKINEDGTTGPIAFTVGDVETAAGSLVVTGAASNTTLVPQSGIVFGGSGANRTVTVTPAANQNGTATITVTVSDGVLSASASFVLTVNPASDDTVTSPGDSPDNMGSDDIGAPAVSGSTNYHDGVYEVRAAGADIWGRKDEFRFVHQQIQGDAEMVVHVASLAKSNAWAKAGLMFRSSLAADAAHVSVFATRSNGVVLQWRSQDGGTSSTSASLKQKVPAWLMLLRTGDMFYAFGSADGVEWDLVEFVEVNLPETVYGGMAVTSHNKTKATTAIFEGFSVD